MVYWADMVDCGPVCHTSPEKYEAMWELASYCGMSVEDMFGISTPRVSTEDVEALLSPRSLTVVDVMYASLPGLAPRDIYCIRRECLLDLLREPTFVTLDKYGGVVARPDEVGRFYGFPVIVSDAMPENVLAMVSPG